MRYSAAALLPEAGRATTTAPADLLAPAPAPRAPVTVAMSMLDLEVLSGGVSAGRPWLGGQGEGRRGESHKENSEGQFAHNATSPIVAFDRFRAQASLPRPNRGELCVRSFRLDANQGVIAVASRVPTRKRGARVLSGCRARHDSRARNVFAAI